MAQNQGLSDTIHLFKTIIRKYPNFQSFNEVELQNKYWYETGRLIDLNKFGFKTIKEMLISSGEFDDEETSYGTRLVPRFLTKPNRENVANVSPMIADDGVHLKNEMVNSGYDGMERFAEGFNKLGIEKSASSGVIFEENIWNIPMNSRLLSNVHDLSSNLSATAAVIPSEEKLQLPWDKPKWDVKITFPKSSTEVWARLADAKSMVGILFTQIPYDPQEM